MEVPLKIDRITANFQKKLGKTFEQKSAQRKPKAGRSDKVDFRDKIEHRESRLHMHLSQSNELSRFLSVGGITCQGRILNFSREQEKESQSGPNPGAPLLKSGLPRERIDPGPLAHQACLVFPVS